MRFVPIVFAISALVASPASFANDVDINGNTSATGKRFDRPDVSGTTVASGSNVAYEDFRLTVAESGDYGFYGGFFSDPPYHNFLFVYSGEFIPATPLANLIIGDDNYVGTYTAYANTHLTAGEVYYLVYTGFDSAAQGPYFGIVDGPGAITLAAVGPVPEPTSWAMLMSGASLMALRIRQRRRSGRPAAMRGPAHASWLATLVRWLPRSLRFSPSTTPSATAA